MEDEIDYMNARIALQKRELRKNIRKEKEINHYSIEFFAHKIRLGNIERELKLLESIREFIISNSDK